MSARRRTLAPISRHSPERICASRQGLQTLIWFRCGSSNTTVTALGSRAMHRLVLMSQVPSIVTPVGTIVFILRSLFGASDLTYRGRLLPSLLDLSMLSRG